MFVSPEPATQPQPASVDINFILPTTLLGKYYYHFVFTFNYESHRDSCSCQGTVLGDHLIILVLIEDVIRAGEMRQLV